MSEGRVLDGHVRDGHVRAWLEIMRISNLPTVLANAIAGAALGLIVIDVVPSIPLAVPIVMFPVTANVPPMVTLPLNEGF